MSKVTQPVKTEVGFVTRQYGYRAYIPNHTTTPKSLSFCDWHWHGHQSNIPSSQSQAGTAIQKPALHERSLTTLFLDIALSSIYKRRNGKGSGVHDCFLSLSPAPAKVKWKAKAEHQRQAGSQSRASGGREKHKAFCEEENGKGFSSPPSPHPPHREAICSILGRGLGNEYIPFYRHPEVDCETLLC